MINSEQLYNSLTRYFVTKHKPSTISESIYIDGDSVDIGSPSNPVRAIYADNIIGENSEVTLHLVEDAAVHNFANMELGYVLQGNGSGTAQLGRLSHGLLTTIGQNDHHDKVHDIIGVDHVVSGSTGDVIAVTSANTLGKWASSTDGDTNVNNILRSDANGRLLVRSVQSENFEEVATDFLGYTIRRNPSEDQYSQLLIHEVQADIFTVDLFKAAQTQIDRDQRWLTPRHGEISAVPDAILENGYHWTEAKGSISSSNVLEYFEEPSTINYLSEATAGNFSAVVFLSADTGNFSSSRWVFRSGEAAGQRLGIYWYDTWEKFRLYYYNPSNAGLAVSAPVVAPAGNVSVICTYNSSTKIAKFYFNGEYVNELDCSAGDPYLTTSGYFDPRSLSTANDVRVEATYNIALTDSQVAKLHHAISEQYIYPTDGYILPGVDNTISLWFDDDPVINDGNLFTQNDFVFIQHWMRGEGASLAEIRGQIYQTANDISETAAVDGYQRWTFINLLDSTAYGKSLNAGNLVVSYGQPGDGWILDSVRDQLPRRQMGTWSGSDPAGPWATDARQVFYVAGYLDNVNSDIYGSDLTGPGLWMDGNFYLEGGDISAGNGNIHIGTDGIMVAAGTIFQDDLSNRSNKLDWNTNVLDPGHVDAQPTFTMYSQVYTSTLTRSRTVMLARADGIDGSEIEIIADGASDVSLELANIGTLKYIQAKAPAVSIGLTGDIFVFDNTAGILHPYLDGGFDIGKSTREVDTIYAKTIYADTIVASVEIEVGYLTGDRWEGSGSSDMTIDLSSASNLILTVTNSGAGVASMVVDGNLTVANLITGGSVDGVDVSGLLSSFNSHVGASTGVHNVSGHVVDSAGDTFTGNVGISSNAPTLTLTDTDGPNAWRLFVNGTIAYLEPENADSTFRIRNLANADSFVFSTADDSLTVAGFLKVESSNNPYFWARHVSGGVYLKNQALSTYGFVGTQSNHDLKLATNNTARVTIDTDGDVSVTNGLTVGGNMTFSSAATINLATSTSALDIGGTMLIDTVNEMVSINGGTQSDYSLFVGSNANGKSAIRIFNSSGDAYVSWGGSLTLSFGTDYSANLSGLWSSFFPTGASTTYGLLTFDSSNNARLYNDVQIDGNTYLDGNIYIDNALPRIKLHESDLSYNWTLRVNGGYLFYYTNDETYWWERTSQTGYKDFRGPSVYHAPETGVAIHTIESADSYAQLSIKAQTTGNASLYFGNGGVTRNLLRSESDGDFFFYHYNGAGAYVGNALKIDNTTMRLTTGGDLWTQGDADIDGYLTVDGDATISGDLYVDSIRSNDLVFAEADGTPIWESSEIAGIGFVFESTNFNENPEARAGVRLTYDGDVYAKNFDARGGKFITSVFEVDSTVVYGGSMLRPSGGGSTVYEAFTTPAIDGSVTIKLAAHPLYGGYVAQAGDRLRIRALLNLTNDYSATTGVTFTNPLSVMPLGMGHTSATLVDIWLEVTALGASEAEYAEYTCTMKYGETSVSIPSFAPVANYTTAGSGAVYETAYGSNAPYTSYLITSDEPWNDANTEVTRIGNLSGISAAVGGGGFGLLAGRLVDDPDASFLRGSSDGVELHNVDLEFFRGEYKTAQITRAGRLTLGADIEQESSTKFDFNPETNSLTIRDSEIIFRQSQQTEQDWGMTARGIEFFNPTDESDTEQEALIWYGESYQQKLALIKHHNVYSGSGKKTNQLSISVSQDQELDRDTSMFIGVGGVPASRGRNISIFLDTNYLNSGQSQISMITDKIFLNGINGVEIGNTFILNYYSIPTTDPGVAGQVWRSGSDLKISAG